MDFRSLRIVVISDAITNRNGVGTYYPDLLSYLRDYIDEAVLVAPELEPGLPHQGFSFPIPGDTTQRLYFPRKGHIKRCLKQIRPHVVIFPTLGPYSVLGVGSAKRSGAKICVGQHTDFHKIVPMCFGTLMAPMIHRIIGICSRQLYNSSSIIVTPSNEEVATPSNRQMAMQKIGTPVSKRFTEIPLSPFPQTVKTVLFLGRLSPEKNLDQFLEASKSLSHLRFLVGGDGPDRKRVEACARQQANVDFLGWLTRDKVINTIDQADLLVLPSKLESFGTVALEAMLRQRNVLISDSCGIRNWEDLTDGLFIWSPPESLEDAIRRVSESDLKLRKYKSDRGFVGAAKFNQKTILHWLKILADLAGLSTEGLTDLLDEPLPVSMS